MVTGICVLLLGKYTAWRPNPVWELHGGSGKASRESHIEGNQEELAGDGSRGGERGEEVMASVKTQYQGRAWV